MYRPGAANGAPKAKVGSAKKGDGGLGNLSLTDMDVFPISLQLLPETYMTLKRGTENDRCCGTTLFVFFVMFILANIWLANSQVIQVVPLIQVVTQTRSIHSMYVRFPYYIIYH